MRAGRAGLPIRRRTTMAKMAERGVDFDEYLRQVALEKGKRATLARDLFLLSILFLVASGAAYFYNMSVASAMLFVVFLIVQSVASETRLEIAMMDANRLLAYMLHQQSREIQQLRVELQHEQSMRTR